MIYIGIDPGARGALAILGWERPVTIVPFNRYEYLACLRAANDSGEECICCIEDVHSLRREGVTSAHNFGRSVGWLLGILDAIGIPYQPITPQKWKKEFGLTSDKVQSVEVCKRLYPDVNLKRTERSKKDDDNCAEALLMATYAKRKF